MNGQSSTGADRRHFIESVALGTLGAVSAAGQAEPAKTKIRLGLIGLGWRGVQDGNHINTLIDQGYPVEITAVCDLYQPRLERAEAHYKARGYSSTADMFKYAAIDAVLIATPDRQHLYNLREAMQAGKDVYIEKPLCHWEQFDLLKAVVHEARKLKRVVQVGSQHLADSVWERAGDLISQGLIGGPVHIQVPNFRNNDAGERSPSFIDDPHAKAGIGLDWEKWQADAPRRDFTIERFFQWRLFVDYSGGPVTDTGVHEISPIYKMLTKLSIDMPERVVATGGRFYFNHNRTSPDTMDVLMQYPQNFTIALLETFVNNQFPIEKVIRCTDGSVIVRPDGVELVPMVRRATSGGQNTVTQAGEEKSPTKLLSDIARERAAAGPNRRYIDPTIFHIHDFLEAVRTRRQPRYDLELGYRVQVPFCMAMRSYSEAKVALWDPNHESIVMS